MADPGLSNHDTAGLRPNRACRNCVQIKAKCVPFEGSDLRICQRCHRLKKPCSTAAPAIRKKPKEQSNSRVNQLERRLDEVTNLLTAIHNNPSPSGNAASLPTPVTLPASSPQAVQDPPNGKFLPKSGRSTVSVSRHVSPEMTGGLAYNYGSRYTP